MEEICLRNLQYLSNWDYCDSWTQEECHFNMSLSLNARVKKSEKRSEWLTLLLEELCFCGGGAGSRLGRCEPSLLSLSLSRLSLREDRGRGQSHRLTGSPHRPIQTYTTAGTKYQQIFLVFRLVQGKIFLTHYQYLVVVRILEHLLIWPPQIQPNKCFTHCCKWRFVKV